MIMLTVQFTGKKLEAMRSTFKSFCCIDATRQSAAFHDCFFVLLQLTHRNLFSRLHMRLKFRPPAVLQLRTEC